MGFLVLLDVPGLLDLQRLLMLLAIGPIPIRLLVFILGVVALLVTRSVLLIAPVPRLLLDALARFAIAL